MRYSRQKSASVALTDEQVARLLFNCARDTAEKRGLEFDLTYTQIRAKVAAGKCEATGIPFDKRKKPVYGPDLPFRASLDRVDNTKGYLKDNVQVVCRIYNHCKWTWDADDVLTLAKALVQRSGDSHEA